MKKEFVSGCYDILHGAICGCGRKSLFLSPFTQLSMKRQLALHLVATIKREANSSSEELSTITSEPLAPARTMRIIERTSEPEVANVQLENERLRRTLREIDVLEEIAGAATSDRPLEGVIELILQRSIDCLDVEQGVVHLFDEKDFQKPVHTLFRKVDSPESEMPFRLGEQLVGWMLENQGPLLINDLTRDSPLHVPDHVDSPIRSLLSVPLLSKGKPVGLLSVFNKKAPDLFSTEDERLLNIIAAHSSHALHTARLIGELREDRNQLARKNTQLLRQIKNQFSSTNIIGSGEKLQAVLRLIDQIRHADVDVLITGESGTGKEMVAKTIHYNSPRADGPFVALNCAALPDTLLEAELFGIEKGVATGVDKRVGQFEAASGGTLLLDEIGDLSLTAQAKILRVLQERVVQRLGGRQTIPVDVRVLAATNKDLEQEAAQSRFREDLLYRLNVIHIQTPPLRAIPEDIEALAKHFLAEACRQMQRDALSLSSEAIFCLQGARWPGNVRQLQNEMKRISLCSQGPDVRVEDISDRIRENSESVPDEEAAGRPLQEAVERYERQLVKEALEQHSNNRAQTARALGMTRQGLLKKLKRFGIESAAAGQSD